MGPNWRADPISSPICSARQCKIVIVFHYCTWRPHILGLTVKACWASGFHSSLTEGRRLHISATLISLLLCQAQPHKPPPSLSACGGCLTHQRNNAHHSTDVFNWQLEPINAEASSHGYGTIKYICAYSWMKIHFQQDLWEKCGNCVCRGPLSGADVWRLTHRTLLLLDQGLLKVWYSPGKDIISRLWTSDLAYLTSGYASIVYTHFLLFSLP